MSDTYISCRQNTSSFEDNREKLADERAAIQKKTFTKWVNSHLNKAGHNIDNLFIDLKDGMNLTYLVELLTNTTLKKSPGRTPFHAFQTITGCLEYLRDYGVKLVNIRTEDIHEGNAKLTLGLIWTLILHFELSFIRNDRENLEGEMISSSSSNNNNNRQTNKENIVTNNTDKDSVTIRGALLSWAKQNASDTNILPVSNFTSSWRDGKAFCSIISKYAPDILPPNLWNNDIMTSKRRLKLAFETANKLFDVPNLLDPEDVDCENPDDKSIMTYLSLLCSNLSSHDIKNIQSEDDKVKTIMNGHMDNFFGMVASFNNKPTTLKIETLKEELNDHQSLIHTMEGKKKKYTEDFGLYVTDTISEDNKVLAKNIGKFIDESIELAKTRLYELQEAFELCDNLNENLTSLDEWFNEFCGHSENLKKQLSNTLEKELSSIGDVYLNDCCDKLKVKEEICSNIMQRMDKFFEDHDNEQIANEIKTIKNNINRKFEESWSTINEIASLVDKQNIDKLEAKYNVSGSSINDDRRIFNDKVAKMEFVINELETIMNRLSPVDNISLDQMQSELSEINDIVLKIDDQTFIMEELRKHIDELKEKVPKYSPDVEERLCVLEDKWKTLTEFFKERSTELDSALIDRGECLQVIEEMINWINTIVKSIQEEDVTNGDVKMIDLEICRLKIIGEDITNHQESINDIKKSLSEEKKLSSSVLEKVSVMDRKYEDLKKLWEKRHNELEVLREEAITVMTTLDKIEKTLIQKEKKLMINQSLPVLKENIAQEKEKFDIMYKEFKDFKEEKLNSISQDMNNDSKIWYKNNISSILGKISDLEALFEEKKKKIDIAFLIGEKIDIAIKDLLKCLDDGEESVAKINIETRYLPILTAELQIYEEFINVLYKKQKESIKDIEQLIDYARQISDKKDSMALKSQLTKISQRFSKLEARRQKKYGILKTKQNEVSTFFDNVNEEISWIGEASKNMCEISQALSTNYNIEETLNKCLQIRDETVKHGHNVHSIIKKGNELEGEALTKEKPEYRDCIKKLLSEWELLDEKTLSTCQIIEDLRNKKLIFDERIEKYSQWCKDLCKCIKKELSENKFGGNLETVEGIEREYEIMMSDLKIQEPFIEIELAKSSDNDSLKKLNDDWNELKQLIVQKSDAIKHAKDKAIDLNTKYIDLQNFLDNSLVTVSLSPVTTKERVKEHIEVAKASVSLIKEREGDFEGVKSLIEDISQMASDNAKEKLEKMLRDITYKWNDTIIRSDAEASIYEIDLQNFETLSRLIEDNSKQIEEYRNEIKKLDSPEDIVSLDVHDFVLQQYLLIKSDIEAHQILINGLFEKINQLSSKSIGKTYLMMEKDILNKEWVSLQQEFLLFGERLDISKDILVEADRLANFTFSEWRDRYMKWHDLGKLRINDIFRNFDHKGTGYLSREDIISPFLLSSFPTTKKEMEKVADEFDEGNNKISVKRFLQALKVPSDKNGTHKTEEMIIENEIQRQLGECKCSEKYNFRKLSTTETGVTYSFGSNSTVKRLVRILQYSIMVRVGGGWETLENFLQTHDPCRMFKKTNSDIYSTLKNGIPNTVSRMESFLQKRHSSYGMSNIGAKSADNTPVRRPPSRQNSKIPIFTKPTNQS
uniref:Calponin-homology (CH) domain-containing protein n=1 Tax=Parastrongyloides trichosuri TaxID=131310 RepID=A0A0N4ZFS9_PARTI